LFIADVVELILTSEQTITLKNLLESTQDLVLASEDAISRLGVEVEFNRLRACIAQHTKKILGTREKQLELAKNCKVIFDVNLNNT